MILLILATIPYMDIGKKNNARKTRFSMKKGIMYTTLMVRLFPFYKLPKRCRTCELLGICRHMREEQWKCYNGCMILNKTNNG